MKFRKKFIREILSLNRLYEVILSLLPDCIMGKKILSDWGTFPLPSIIKQKAYKYALLRMLTGHAK